MSPNGGASASPHRRRTRSYAIVGVVIVVVVLALLLVPARTQSQTLTVSPGASPSASFSFSGPTYVTMHFSSSAAYGMRYWMTGPSGMMYDHSMMAHGMMGGSPDSDSYSFWTWGGEYTCGATLTSGGPASTPVWVNATSAVL